MQKKTVSKKYLGINDVNELIKSYTINMLIIGKTLLGGSISEMLLSPRERMLKRNINFITVCQ